MKERLAALSERERARAREAVGLASEPFTTGGRLRLVATALCATGRPSEERT